MMMCHFLLCTGDGHYDQSSLVSNELDEDVSVGSLLVSNSAKVCLLGLHFWPTVLSVVPLVQCVVCDVLYCGETVHLS